MSTDVTEPDSANRPAIERLAVVMQQGVLLLLLLLLLRLLRLQPGERA